MYPTLFTIGSIRIDTYSVVWFIALSLAILWGIRRLSLYNLDEDEARRVMAISFLCMLLGARSPEYFINWREYFAKPSLFLDMNRGNLYEFGAISGAFVSALLLCRFSKGKTSFLKLCDVSVIPAFLAIALGRWGCFLNGCCVGSVTDFCLAVHFPADRAGVLRHPVQIYYSVIAGIIVLILLLIERKLLPLQRKVQRHYSVIAPLGIILYAVMRFSIAIVRYSKFSWQSPNSWTYRALAAALPLACAWLAYSLIRLKADSSHK